MEKSKYQGGLARMLAGGEKLGVINRSEIHPDLNDLVAFLYQVMPLVLQNAPKNSAVAQAFKLLDHVGNYSDPSWSYYDLAASAWENLKDDAKRAILNGWRVPKRVPLTSRVLREKGYGSAQASLVAIIGQKHRRDAYLRSKIELSTEREDCVHVHVPLGIPKDELLSAMDTLRKIFDARWPEILNLEAGQEIYHDEEKFQRAQLDRKSAAKPKSAAA